MKDKTESIIDEAYKLYMPQDNYEITELTRFLVEQKQDNDWNILEIGTKFGGTFYIWNSINLNGMNISIDMSDGGIHGGISEEEMDKRDLWFQKRFNNCHFIRGDSHNLKTSEKMLDILVPDWENIGGKEREENWVDFLFIDGDHSYEGAKQDFLDYGRFVKKGGIITFHDVNDSQRHRDRNVYVSQFWKELTENIDENNITEYNGNRYLVYEFNSNLDWAGIGTLTKL